MRTRTIVLAAFAAMVALAVTVPAAGAVQKPRPADAVYKNGYVYTVDPSTPEAQAIAVPEASVWAAR
jgi:hypothetical protein